MSSKQLIKKEICKHKEYPLDYQNEIKKAVSIISIPQYPITLFGSSVFKSLLYAGDVDIFQVMDIDDIAPSMQTVIKKINKSNFILGDIKSGVNPILYPLSEMIGEIKDCKCNYKFTK